MGRITLPFNTHHSREKGVPNNLKEPFAVLGKSSSQKK